MFAWPIRGRIRWHLRAGQYTVGELVGSSHCLRTTAPASRQAALRPAETNFGGHVARDFRPYRERCASVSVCWVGDIKLHDCETPATAKSGEF